MKRISILGSTGSIGTQTLSIAEEHGDELSVVALTCGGNIDLLEKQIRAFHPIVASVSKEEDAKELALRVRDTDTRVVSGMDGLLETATLPEADIVVTAVVGMIGLRPTIAAIEAKKTIALANKETLVCGGHLIMPLAKKLGVSILPVDSEHSAIFQSLQGNENNKLKRIILTASGGPFRGKKRHELSDVGLEQALKHPNWSMGAKITIDSATMINKGLEVSEAGWLFDAAPEQIDVHVHPQSVVHSAVEYEDGAVMAQLGTPDMRIPIAYALFYPDRKPLSGDPLDLFATGTLTFEKPDTETFFGLSLAYEAMKRGGSAPTVFNAANEAAVARFLNKEIRFLDIADTVGQAMEECRFIEDPSLEEILETERQAREFVTAK